MKNELQKGAILLLSGPSGCGKSSLLNELYKEIDNFYFSISTTTRKPRDGEKDGIDYFFVSKDEFEKDIDDGYFLEYATVHGNYYGTSLKPIISSLNDAKLVILDIDVQGYEIVKKQKLKNLITSVFITTPTLKELEKRLISRGTDTNQVIQQRMQNATSEIEQISIYDYFIVNDDLEKSAQLLISIARTALVKTKLLNTNNIIKQWIK
jgi:guanylate kinase